MKKKIAFAMIMGIITTGIISFLLISINRGFNNGFVYTWLNAWWPAYLAVIPLILFIAPRIQQLVDIFFKDNIAEKET